jgi:hypothetical protein
MGRPSSCAPRRGVRQARVPPSRAEGRGTGGKRTRRPRHPRGIHRAPDRHAPRRPSPPDRAGRTRRGRRRVHRTWGMAARRFASPCRNAGPAARQLVRRVRLRRFAPQTTNGQEGRHSGPMAPSVWPSLAVCCRGRQIPTNQGPMAPAHCPLVTSHATGDPDARWRRSGRGDRGVGTGGWCGRPPSEWWASWAGSPTR